MFGANEPGGGRADEERPSARARREHVTSRRVGMAVTAGSAVFSGCAAAVFLWAIPTVAGTGPAMAWELPGPHPAVGTGGAGATAPPGGTARYVLHADPRTRNGVVEANASPDTATVRLDCPVGRAGTAGADGRSCRLSAAGPVDIPATVYLPASLPPGTDVRVTAVVSDSAGETVQDTVIQVVPAAGSPADPAPSSRPARTPWPAPIATHTRTPDPAPSTTQTTPWLPDPSHRATAAPVPARSGTPAPAPGGAGTPAPKASSSGPSPSPSHSGTSTSKHRHRGTSAPKPSHSGTPAPEHRHSGTAPPSGRSKHHSGTARSSHPAQVGRGHGAGPSPGGGAPAASVGQRPLPMPALTTPGAVGIGEAQPGIRQPDVGAIQLPPADRPAPAPILPLGQPGPRAQPSPLPLPRVTRTPGAYPSSPPARQTVVLPNRAQMATSDPPFTFDLAEAQIIGLAMAFGGAVAALLRPARTRPDQASQRPERPAGSPQAGTRQPRFRALRRLRARTR